MNTTPPVDISIMREVIQYAEDTAYAHVALAASTGVFPRLDPPMDACKLLSENLQKSHEKFSDLPSAHEVYTVLFQEVFAKIVNATQYLYGS